MNERDDLIYEAIRVFEPIIDLLASMGVAGKDAQRILQQVWVRRVYEAELRKLAPGSRKRISKARLAILAGVQRNAVAEILDSDQMQIDTAHRAVRVLRAWHTLPKYSKNGRPLPLKLGARDEKGSTIWSLVREVAPDTWPTTVLRELTTRGAVEERDGLYRVKQNIYESKTPQIAALQQLGDICYDLTQTILHNSTATPAARRSVFSVMNTRVPQSSAKRVRRQLKEIADTLQSHVEAATSTPEAAKDKELVRMGAFFFAIEDEGRSAARPFAIATSRRSKVA
jgi:Family of unknown function (DUF6502)